MALSFCWTSGLSASELRVRSSHGFRIMPEMPWFGPLKPLTMNRVSVSGNDA